jgi:hypothetical protein
MAAAAASAPAVAQAQELVRTNSSLIVASLLIALAALIVVFTAGIKIHRQRLEAILKLVEQGHPLPRELIAALRGKPFLTVVEQRRRDRRLGVSLLGWAIGTALAFYLYSGQARSAAWSLIFLFLSAACFVNLLVSKLTEGSGEPDGPPPNQ